MIERGEHMEGRCLIERSEHSCCDGEIQMRSWVVPVANRECRGDGCLSHSVVLLPSSETN